ncbi:MAG: hypothetical protein AAGI51_18665 [Pseudomonadota bacterium]
MVEDMIERARQNGLYDHRRITAPPRKAGWSTIRGRVARLRRREAPKVPGKQPRKTRPRLIDGACARFRPEPRNHARPHDVAHHRTEDGGPSARSTSWTSSPANAWRSASRGS